MKAEKDSLEVFLRRLKESSPDSRNKFIDGLVVTDEVIKITESFTEEHLEVNGKPRAKAASIQHKQPNLNGGGQVHTPPGEAETLSDNDSNSKVDVSTFLSFNEQGQACAFGPASSLHEGNPAPSRPRASRENVCNELIANAALQRQQEYELNLMPNIDGIDTELATHLLDLHWNRQHHTFLLTYRPALTRHLIRGGPYASSFLVNAIFATASKYSDRPELIEEASSHGRPGDRFFRRCDELLAQSQLYARSDVPTVAGLLLLGSTFIALGDVSRGWLYSGLAFRMIFDLGLHIEHAHSEYDEEELEIRRRLFWGAFICDKLQSLYTGRPAYIDPRHCSVSRDFLDSFEERELWSPYVDFKSSQLPDIGWLPTPIRSISTFTQLCTLADLMTKVIECIYVMHPSRSIAKSTLSSVDRSFQDWVSQLPAELRFKPWEEAIGTNRPQVTPNVLNLNAMYHALVILRYRPFLSDGHLRFWYPPTEAWKHCTEAANCIAGIVASYRNIYSLRRGPYMLSYAAYVACTIHVRNAALEDAAGQASILLATTLEALSELTTPNPGVHVPLDIIKRLIKRYNVNISTGEYIFIIFDFKFNFSQAMWKKARIVLCHCPIGRTSNPWTWTF